jgi:uncharacterized membrane protein
MAKFAKSIMTDDGPDPIPTPAPAPVAPAPAAAPVTPPPTPAPAAASSVPADFGVVEEEALKKEDEHWAKAYWRPAMGWLYMLICLMDFVVFPAISMFIPIITKLPYVAWASLSLSNGGLIHMAFGAILGVAAYGRTQEKVASKQ